MRDSNAFEQVRKQQKLLNQPRWHQQLSHKQLQQYKHTQHQV